jgi:hypothetical protein
MGGAVEVSAVVGLMEPTRLTSSFAGLAAWGWCTEVLVPHIPGVWIKECLTVLTLALSDVTYHWPPSPEANDHQIAAWKEEHRKENAGKRRGRRPKKKLIAMAGSGRKRTGATLHFHSIRLTTILGHR